MSLSAFIRDHHEEIIVEFAVFAKTVMPTSADMSEAELRDHAEEILTAAVHDIGTAQTGEEQSRKSKGHGSARAMAASGGFMRITASTRLHVRIGVRGVSRAARHRVAAVRGERSIGPHGGLPIQRSRGRSADRIDGSVRGANGPFRDQFIGVLSHDLRTPLGVITTSAAVLAVPRTIRSDAGSWSRAS